MTKTQVITLIMIFAYIVWEIYVRNWAATISGPIIRVDLIIIYPIILTLLFVSVFQIVKGKNKR